MSMKNILEDALVSSDIEVVRHALEVCASFLSNRPVETGYAEHECLFCGSTKEFTVDGCFEHILHDADCPARLL